MVINTVNCLYYSHKYYLLWSKSMKAIEWLIFCSLKPLYSITFIFLFCINNNIISTYTALGTLKWNDDNYLVKIQSVLLAVLRLLITLFPHLCFLTEPLRNGVCFIRCWIMLTIFRVAEDHNFTIGTETVGQAYF